MSLSTVKMCDVCEITSSKRIFAKEYIESGVPFFRGKEVVEKFKGVIDVSTELFISENRFDEIKNKFGAPQKGDLLLTSVGTIGIPYLVDGEFDFYFKDGNLTWFKDLQGIDSNYLFYWLISPQGKAELSKCTIGAAQPAYTIARLKDMEIKLPDEQSQIKISSILRAYDESIKTNSHRIQLLEESALLLYKEWFLRLRFPGHEHVKIKSGVPDGWEKKPLGDVIEIKKGKNITAETAIEGDVPVVAGGLTPAYYHNIANVVGPAITVSASGANAGFVNLYHENIWASDCSYVGADATDYIYYFYLLLTSQQSEISMLQKGAAQPHVYPKDLMRLTVLCPPENFVKYFEQEASKNFLLVGNLIKQNKLLAKARDVLLPRLMNGEVDV